MPKMPLKNKIIFLVSSFVIVGFVLHLFFNVALLPIIIGGSLGIGFTFWLDSKNKF